MSHEKSPDKCHALYCRKRYTKILTFYRDDGYQWSTNRCDFHSADFFSERYKSFGYPERIEVKDRERHFNIEANCNGI